MPGLSLLLQHEGGGTAQWLTHTFLAWHYLMGISMELSFELPPPPPAPPPPKVFADHWTKVGAGIKQLRNARGLTQAQLAELVGVERTSITNIEKGQQRLGLDLLDKIATALGMRLTMRLEPLDACGVLVVDDQPNGPQSPLEQKEGPA